MKVTLPSGKLAQIGVKYTSDEQITNRKAKNGEDSVLHCRGAHIRLTIDGLLDEEVRSVCKPPDVFSRTSARKVAITRLLKKVGKQLNKEDCQAILKLVCPSKPSYKELKKENNVLRSYIHSLVLQEHKVCCQEGNNS